MKKCIALSLLIPSLACGAAVTPSVDLRSNQSIGGTKTFTSAPRVPTQAQHDNSTKAASTAYVDAALSSYPSVITAGTYIPTAVAGTNILSTTGYKARWTRIGNIVTVTGRLLVEAVSSGVTMAYLPLPVASILSSVDDGGGTGSAWSPTSVPSVTISPDTDNNRMQFVWTDDGTFAKNIYYTFSYEVH